TLRALEEALEDFAGCAVIISHDRWFLDRIATHMLAFEGDSHVEWFEGNFQDYEADKMRRLGTDSTIPHPIKYKKFSRWGYSAAAPGFGGSRGPIVTPGSCGLAVAGRPAGGVGFPCCGGRQPSVGRPKRAASMSRLWVSTFMSVIVGPISLTPSLPGTLRLQHDGKHDALSGGG